MSTTELKTRMHIDGPDNYMWYVCYESPAGWLYNGTSPDYDKVERVRNEKLTERAKDKNGLTLRQALVRLVEDATYYYTHDDDGNRNVKRLK